jgi:hypothetical protein
MKNKKLTVVGIIWFLGVSIVALMLFGCACPQCDEHLVPYEGNPEFKPLPPEKLHDLLHVSENYAYKSITKKDYEAKDEC